MFKSGQSKEAEEVSHSSESGQSPSLWQNDDDVTEQEPVYLASNPNAQYGVVEPGHEAGAVS